MNWHFDQKDLRIVIEADNEVEREWASPIVENVRVLTVVLAFLSLLTSMIPYIGMSLAALTFITSLTGITRVAYAEAELTEVSAKPLTANEEVVYSKNQDHLTRFIPQHQTSTIP